MQIKSIRISNILSFEHKATIDQAELITFEKGLNVLIGPNGAGKSNFLEIINQIFKNILFKEPDYDFGRAKSYLTDPQNNPSQNTINPKTVNVSHLAKNKYSNSDDKKIEISLSFSKADKKNLRFVFDHATELNQLLAKYSRIGEIINNSFTKSDLNKVNSLTLLLESSSNNPNNDQFNISLPITSDVNNFIMIYLEWFEFIQRAIEVGIALEKKKWQTLHTTFTLMGCYRNYGNLDGNYGIGNERLTAIKEVHSQTKAENTKALTTNPPAGFEMVKRTLTYEFNNLLHNTKRTKNDVAEDIKENDLLITINSLLKEPPLELELNIKKVDDNNLQYNIFFKSLKDNTQINIEELSAGQKAILHFIFSIFGFDLKNGLVIIDEPELHLHPQVQEQFLEIIESVANDIGIQFIIATHSPVFVTAKTVSNIFRFSKVNNYSAIKHPKVTQSDKELIRIVNYTNSSKIFFADKVILVEGESDEYFYPNFLKSYFDTKSNKLDIEFISITGKGDRKLWFEFLNKFNIKTYFIGDWDNVFDLNILKDKDFEKFKDDYQSKILTATEKALFKNKNSKDRVALLKTLTEYLKTKDKSKLNELSDLQKHIFIRHLPYGDIIKDIKSRNSKKYNAINKKIEKAYKNGVFVLKSGELEDYIGTNKGLESVISFFKGNFQDYFKKRENRQYFNELIKIFQAIVQD